MPGHSFEDRQRKAGYDSFSRAAQDTTPAPTRGTISFGSSDPAKKSNREFNEELERQQREQEQARGTPLAGEDSRKNTQAQIQNIRETFEDPNKVFQDARGIRNIADPPFGVLQAPIDDFGNMIGDFRGIFSGGFPKFNFDFSNFPSLFGIGVKALDLFRGPTVESFRNPDFLATIEKKFKDDPNFSREDFYREYRDEIDQVFDVGLGDLTSEEMFRAQSEKAFNQAATGELGSDLQQRVNPVGYYTDDEGKVRNVPATAAQAKEMVDAFRFANLDEDPAFKNLSNAEKRRLTAAIMEAQAIDYDRQTRQDANMRQTTDPNEGSFGKPFTPRPGPTPPPGGGTPPSDPTFPVQQPGQPFFPFPSTGIASIFNPAFMGPSFDPRMSDYARQGRGAFDQFYRNLEAFPVV